MFLGTKQKKQYTLCKMFNQGKELSLCHKLWFFNLYILATQCRKPLISVILNNLSSKYQRFTPSGCNNIEMTQFEFVAKTQFLLTHVFLTEKNFLLLHGKFQWTHYLVLAFCHSSLMNICVISPFSIKIWYFCTWRTSLSAIFLFPKVGCYDFLICEQTL